MWKRFAKVALILSCLAFLFAVAKKEDNPKEEVPATDVIAHESGEEYNEVAEEESKPVFEPVFNPNVRVVIRNASFEGLYHKDVLVTSSKPYELLSPKGELYAEYDAGDTISFSSFRMKTGESLVLKSKEQERFSIDSLTRSQGVPFYRGMLQIYKEDGGYIIVNELPLEEYLLTVVPSEMPSSYPMDALSAQAVCARSYAYSFIANPGYPQYEAHMDDSTSYQVYNNIEENDDTTQAVRNTQGVILVKDGMPVSTYFFSTSCGITSNEKVWSLKNNENEVMFSPVHVSLANSEETVAAMTMEDSKSLYSAQNLCKEEVFSAFISNKNPENLETNEQWYRWEYQGKLQPVKLFEKISDIYAEKPEAVRLLKDGEFEAEEPKAFKHIYNVSVAKRLPGGVADELLIETDVATYLIKSEYYIRKVLADESGTVIRNDKSKVSSMALLPSAYFVINPRKDSKGNVKSIVLTGGGYGHGVGMSQNGAKCAAQSGMNWKEILSFFYTNLEMIMIEK